MYTLRIQTTTILPGGTLVMVEIGIDADGRFTVSDACAAIEEVAALGHGLITLEEECIANQIALRHGCSFTGRKFVIADVDPDKVHAAVAHVASAALEWCNAVLNRGQFR